MMRNGKLDWLKQARGTADGRKIKQLENLQEDDLFGTRLIMGNINTRGEEDQEKEDFAGRGGQRNWKQAAGWGAAT